MRHHKCAGPTARAIRLQQLSALLDLPYKWLYETHGPTKLMRIQEQVETMEDELRAEARCLDCGAMSR